MRYFPALVFLVLAFISCDDDFTSVGGGLIGGDLDEVPNYEAGVVAYTQELTAVQTNNLSANLLGVYKEPVYGVHTANVLTQISLSANNPSFGNEPRLDSVVLTVPYFSTQTDVDLDGNPVYELDSIYGNSPFKLTIARSNYFLNDYDPDANFESRQKYYSNLDPTLRNSLVGQPLYVNESFKPSNSSVSYRQPNDTGSMDTVTVSPRMRIHLSTEFFKENILEKEGSAQLLNGNNFRNFIRGLYFMAEPVNEDGSMMLLNFANGEAGITLYYTNVEEEDEVETEEERSFKINFGPNRVNTFVQELPEAIKEDIASSNEEEGAANLYLKGGEGSMAIIKLFEDEAELAELREKDWLINDANLTFYVNRTGFEQGQAEPSRVYLYNLDKNELLFDYRIDPTGWGAGPCFGLYFSRSGISKR
ncbi:DUF4270 domain-containing protein [Antarcticibacterium sp. 1MA-6-2]|uniref:DUF4270 domain-containing protein n=1 Tax=Antarcticibacterium sp. 1MA-6-2 TaxID=2908210 RepID=UPI0021064788|nr:DUF4270 domain-containing protein [Antarcticibacterium sp. 1MA-6-2]